MKNLEITIQQSFGLHARPASLFVQKVQKYKSDVKVSFGSKTVNGKSLIGMLNLGVTQNSKILITIEGEDEQNVLDELYVLVEQEFNG